MRRTAALAAAAGFAAAVAGAGGAAVADGLGTAERFVRMCQSPSPGHRAACGDLVGAVMGVLLAVAEQEGAERVICPPRMLSDEDARLIFLYWVDEEPEWRSVPFPEIVLKALESRYPCKHYLKEPGRR